MLLKYSLVLYSFYSKNNVFNKKIPLSIYREIFLLILKL
nr:MAG TPA: hypothetical protein [Caudoviricetes sp.]